MKVGFPLVKLIDCLIDLLTPCASPGPRNEKKYTSHQDILCKIFIYSTSISPQISKWSGTDNITIYSINISTVSSVIYFGPICQSALTDEALVTFIHTSSSIL